MKPKKGNANAEMDEPVKNPLQLVKELVLLIVEARTPDLSVKGRVEGPHCPVFRGRPVHKCSAEKTECVRASEFCCLAQRLWLNSVPICLDILLLPDCCHGREEVLVTEGTVTKLSQENALLAERWTIEGSKKRQGDCLSSSMLTQAVRSYLHFSQISSWLYSTGGKLPGLLAYRVYAPGEMTSLDFLQAPDIHTFPVCLANVDHIRVQVSSLQRQNSVPLLVCYYEQAMAMDYREALDRNDSNQKKKSEEVEVKLKNETLLESIFPAKSVNSCSEYPEGTEKSKKTCLSTLGTKARKKHVKSLQEVSAQALPEKELCVCASHVTCATSLLPLNSSFTARGTFKYLGDHKGTLSDAEITAKKVKNRNKMKAISAGGDCQVFSDVLCATRTYSAQDILFKDESLDVNTDPGLFAAKLAHGALGTGIKTLDMDLDQSFSNETLTFGTKRKNKPPYFDTSHCEDVTSLEAFSAGRKKHAKVFVNDRKKDYCIKQEKVVMHPGEQERENAKQMEVEEEYKDVDEGQDDHTLIKKKKKAEYSKFKKSLHKEHSCFYPTLELSRVTELSQDLLGDKNVDKSDGRILLFSGSPEKNMFDPLHSRSKSALYSKISKDSKLQAKKSSNISEKEANEEELIRILSDRLALVSTHEEETYASPKFSRKFQNLNISTNDSFLLTKSMPAKEISRTKTTSSHNGVIQCERKSEVQAAGLNPKHIVQDSNLCHFTYGSCNLPDIDDSDDTPVASPNQTPQLKLTSESLIKTVAEKSIKQRCHWSQQDIRKPFHSESLLQLTPQTSSKSKLQIENKLKIATEELALQEVQPICKPNIKSQTITNIRPLIALNSNDQMPDVKKTEENNVLPPVNVSIQNQSEKACMSPFRTSCGDMNSQLSMGNGHISEITYNELPLTGSRRMFEENLLPLVSYDADSDSFRKVEELYSSNILHSPKVLFSCDVPNTRVTCSKKCIDFDSTYEAEFFRSRISELMNTEAIGKYMSDLATLSSSISNCQENKDAVSSVDLIKHFKDLPQHNLPSNPDESPKNIGLLEQWKETQKVQASAIEADFNPIHSFYLMKEQNKNDHFVKSRKLDNPAHELFSEKDYALNKSTSNKTRRQLNLNVDNSKPSLIQKIEHFGGETVSPADEDVAQLKLHSSPVHEHNFQNNEAYLESTLPVIISSEIAESFILEHMDSLSPSLSSSCSSSSSSTSSVQMVSHSVLPEPPLVSHVASTFKQDSFKVNKNSEEVSSRLDYHKPILSSNLISEHSVDNTSIVLAERNHGDLKSDGKSCISDFPSASFSQPSTSLSTPGSFLNIKSILENLPSPTLQSLLILPSSQENICLSDQGSPSSLSRAIIPNVLSHGNTDIPQINSVQGANCSLENKARLPNFCHQKTHIVDTDSPRVPENEISQSVNLLLTKLSFNKEPSVNDHDISTLTVRNQGISLDIEPVLETPCHNQQLPIQTHLELFSKPENVIVNSGNGQFINFSAVTSPSFYNSPNKTPPKADIKKINENLSNLSSKEVDADNLLTPLVHFDSVTAARTNSVKRTTEPKKRTTTFHCDTYGDQAMHDSYSDIYEIDQESSCTRKDIISQKEIVKKSIGSSTGINSNSTKIVISEVSSLSCNQSELCFITNNNSGSSTLSLDEKRIRDKINPFFVDLCPFSREISELDKTSEVGHIKHQTQAVRLKETYVEELDCRNGCSDEGQTGNASDVVFYLFEPDRSTKGNSPASVLSSSLNNFTTSKNYRAVRPSSFSAEINLEMKLRSSPGIINNGNQNLSRSPPCHTDPPGWSSVPPHRTVSTPSCMDRESQSKEERASNISVIQKPNCDNVSQTGLRRMAAKSVSMIFNNRTGLPTHSSPAPLKRRSGGRFDYDVGLLNSRAIKNAFSCSKLTSNVDNGGENGNEEDKKRTLSTSAPASTNCLLGNFEESILNGRIDPIGTVDGFTAEIGASGSFCPKHLYLPVSAFFFALSDDNAPSPYLGHINLESVGKKGYHIPKKGTVQVTLFNPNKTVVKMFVVVYDFSDMPVSSQTFIRQRTVFSPVDKNHTAPTYLRYLIHLRCASSHSGKIYLHTDIRLIFARHKLDIDAKTIPYELKSYTEGPQNPKYSPKK